MQIGSFLIEFLIQSSEWFRNLYLHDKNPHLKTKNTEAQFHYWNEGCDVN